MERIREGGQFGNESGCLQIAEGRCAAGRWLSESRERIGILATDANMRIGGVQNDGVVGSLQETIWGQ